MSKPLRQISGSILTLSLIFALFGCTSNVPTAATSTDTTNHITVPQQADPLLDKSAFSYQTISSLEALASTDHIFCCSQSEAYMVLSVCSDNGKDIGPTAKTDCLALYTFEDDIVSYPIETDAYIVSAVPYNGGVVYVEHTELADGNWAWFMVMTDGTTPTLLDTGTASYYNQTPSLFLVDSVPHYMCHTAEGYCIKKIEGQHAETVHSEDGCYLLTVEAESNGKQYCYLIKYPSEEFSRVCIRDINGATYQHLLNGKPTHFAITDRYAVCNTGIEETERHSIEAIDLSNGNAIVFAHSYGALYCLAGSGAIGVCVDYKWQPHAIDIENQRVFSISGPKYETNSDPIYFKPIGENRFFVLYDTDNGYEFYTMNISLPAAS